MTTQTDELFHYGTLRKSGRFPWGSGENPGQRNREFQQYVDDLRKSGMSDSEIAKGLDITRVQLQANLALIKHQQKQDEIIRAKELKEQGLSNVAIGLEMDKNESSVRALLAEGAEEKNAKLKVTADMLREQVDAKGMVDVGTGAHYFIPGVSPDKFNQAVAMLREEDYNLYNFQIDQATTGKKTNMKVLARPDIEYKAVYQELDKIHQIKDFTDTDGSSFATIQKPLAVDLKRVGVRYAEDGGATMDGVIHVRRGVEDISLGNSKYAQVRIAVGEGKEGTHYLKGMAVYDDNLPKGVDLMFNTNKSNTGNKLDAMKPLKEDKKTGQVDDSNPFGAIVRQQFKKDSEGNFLLDSDGKKQLASAMNIVNEEGSWDKWGKNLASQMVSKQSVSLAQRQLDLKHKAMLDDYDEIMSLTNPTIKKKLLQSFADNADSSAVHLKAAAMPRQRTQVILPSNSMKDNEIYAPNFRNGEKVVLVRYPHGGTFEIPELTVNNSRANKFIDAVRGAKDAVVINSKVAERLSGADFDGDTVLVIPNNDRAIKTKPPLKALEGFDAKAQYSMPDDAIGIKHAKNPNGLTGRLMGDISNLITDMTILGASDHELARAVKHSMVVIDAQKHHLNYKQSAKDNQIAALKVKYQGRADGGASTLISRSTSSQHVEKRTLRKAKDGGPIDPETGKKVYTKTGEGYTNAKGVWIPRKEESTKMAEVDDARDLIPKDRPISMTEMERVYAEHANRLKALANTARKEEYYTPPSPWSNSAKKAYAKEVASLNDKLETALRNAPLERQAQVFANVRIKATMQAEPDMDKKELKKLKTLALEEARNRVNAKKKRIEVTPMEWDAIQAGAVSPSKLKDILDNMRDEDIKALATPRVQVAMSPVKKARAEAMLNANYTAAEVADALGVSVSTLNNSLKKDGE
ncbi:helix-turn-helix DNA-binding protein [Arthrobacter phage Darby]|uniref:Helix-turn-helix DNA-binding protein n=1 Tax=Arthrobacter phage Darby TaxID=2951390 RepID=A0A9E7SYG7_9CAUD|nr:helix-turn-helix DNA-binding protein [Arthrobacter phage Darby]UTN92091.1 helix-turn-helix DNA-binding protein [Arthrobacter phage Darby]